MQNKPILKELKIIKKKDKFPIANHLEKSGIYIPSGPDISKKHIHFISKTINNFLLNHCEHDIVNDSIDIDPDKSESISYCIKCNITFSK